MFVKIEILLILDEYLVSLVIARLLLNICGYSKRKFI